MRGGRPAADAAVDRSAFLFEFPPFGAKEQVEGCARRTQGGSRSRISSSSVEPHRVSADV